MQFIIHSPASSEDNFTHSPKHVLRDTHNCTRVYTPTLHDFHYTVRSQDTVKYTAKDCVKNTPNRTRLHTPSLLDHMVPSKLSRLSQVLSDPV